VQALTAGAFSDTPAPSSIGREAGGRVGGQAGRPAGWLASARSGGLCQSVASYQLQQGACIQSCRDGVGCLPLARPSLVAHT